MSNKNQTAVEWLFDKITQNQDIRWRGTQYEDLIEQAKAMEKEQIIDACNQNEFEEEDNLGIAENLTKGEQYYKETYE